MDLSTHGHYFPAQSDFPAKSDFPAQCAFSEQSDHLFINLLDLSTHGHDQFVAGSQLVSEWEMSREYVQE
jgi:hypothetical protein